MKLKNSTDFPDWFLRRMISFICKNECMEWSVKKIKEVVVRNRSRGRYSGRAFPWRKRIVLSIGTAESFRPYLRGDDNMFLRDGDDRAIKGEPDLDKRIDDLIFLAAHEVAHLAQIVNNRYSEKGADWKADRVMDEFRENREELLTAWNAPPAYAIKLENPKPSVQEVRHTRAQKNLDNWAKKSKLAATKLKKYRKQVRYYEKALGLDAEAAKKGK